MAHNRVSNNKQNIKESETDKEIF